MHIVRFAPVVLLAVFLGLFGFAWLNTDSGTASPLLQKPLPYFYLSDVLHAGQSLNASELRKPSLLVFWASWCGICKADLPVLGAFAKDHRVPFYGIAYHDEPYALKAALKNLEDRVTFTALGMDDNGAVASAFGLIGVPTLFVIDRNGRIQHVYTGQVSTETLNRAVLPLL